MSEKIYFSTANRFSVKKSLVNLTTRLHHTLAPSHAKSTARKLLLTPARTKPKNRPPQGLRMGEVESKEGLLTTYQLGSGPIWILTHGWSGTASQFFPLMVHMASQGYTALAYDHPGHGQSGGRYGHIPAFVHGLDAILDSVDEVAGLVGHSMGTASALECHHRKLVDKPLLLIAPVLDYLDNLFSSIKRSGYSMKLFNAIVSDVEEQYRYPVQSIDPYSKLKQRRSPTIIVHDQDDQFTHYSVSQNAAREMDRVTLISTQGQGHGRVMKCQEVMHGFDQLILGQPM
ncbi:alpha/beta fold hydrolase [Vibrio ostreicida]|uniref:alpha/beta fold hydrolase n=1 Tax=Vibrio ostreicida TaxID=526588 RepID=UPI0009709D42|nr:alpha/beta fold hydrolase [Vibrio ostreicida]